MPDRPINVDSQGLDGDSFPSGDAGLAAQKESRSAGTGSQDGRKPVKRKGPIINQKGPSEVDRALKMSRLLTGRGTPGSGAKPVGGRIQRGTVVRIERTKGFGFILDSAGQQRFFHRSAVLERGFDALEEQQSVEFEPQQDERGARALKVRPASASSGAKAGHSPRPSGPQKATPKVSAWKSDLSPFRSGTGTSTIKRSKIKI